MQLITTVRQAPGHYLGTTEPTWPAARNRALSCSAVARSATGVVRTHHRVRPLLVFSDTEVWKPCSWSSFASLSAFACLAKTPTCTVQPPDFSACSADGRFSAAATRCGGAGGLPDERCAMGGA